MGNEIERRLSGDMKLAHNPSIHQPNRWTPEGKELIRQDRRAVINERKDMLDAMRKSKQNQLAHLIKQEEARLRQERAQAAMAAGQVLRKQARLMAAGEGEVAEMENMDFYNAWKANEVFRIQTDHMEWF